ncbi:hypothetical protein BC940DRAFT_318950 [Gongronella butleri]|nr:hypothetical protein BC940DRAFT_318950 [Gongronella butleri]
MELHRPGSSDTISVPTEIILIILKITDRSTLKELRLCSRRMRDIVNPFVFDKLRIGTTKRSPTARELAFFKYFWFNVYETQPAIIIVTGFRPSYDLWPLVRSMSFVHFDYYDVDFIRQLLNSCPNLSQVYIDVRPRAPNTNYNSRAAQACIRFLMGSQQVESLKIQSLSAARRPARGVEFLEPCFPRHLSLLSSIGSHFLLNLRIVSKLHFVRLTSLALEWTACVPGVAAPLPNDRHVSQRECGRPGCYICPFMPMIQQLTITVRPLFRGKSNYWFHSVLPCFAVKFPALRALNIQSYNNRPTTEPRRRTYELTQRLWTQLSTVEIRHVAQSEIVAVLKRGELHPPHPVQVTTIHCPRSAT